MLQNWHTFKLIF